MASEREDVTRQVLGYFGAAGGWEPGGFTGLIMRAYQKADPGNRARLRLGFPEIAEDMDAVMDTMDGIERLQERLSNGPATL